MDLSNYKILRQEVEDYRFGTIDLLESINEPKSHVMIKKQALFDEEEFNRISDRFQTRMRIVCPNLLDIFDVQSNTETLTLTLVIEYPFDDLEKEAEPDVRNPKELYTFLLHITTAMAALEDNQLVHGDIRPEFIAFNSSKKTFLLLDNLRDLSLPMIVQKQNMELKDDLFLPPAIFNEMMKERFDIPHNPYKLESFCLGMTILSWFLERKEIQEVYKNPNNSFDKNKFNEFIEKVSATSFQNHLMRILGDYILLNLLPFAPSDRLSPKKALLVLQGDVSQAMISERDLPKPNYDLPAIEVEIETPKVFAIPEEPVPRKVIVAEVQDLPPTPPPPEPKRDIEIRKPVKIVTTVLPIQRARDPKLDLDAYREIYFVNADLSYKNGSKVVNVSPAPKREPALSYNLITSDDQIDRTGVTFKRPVTPEISKIIHGGSKTMPQTEGNITPRINDAHLNKMYQVYSSNQGYQNPSQPHNSNHNTIEPSKQYLLQPPGMRSPYETGMVKDQKYSANSVNSNQIYVGTPDSIHVTHKQQIVFGSPQMIQRPRSPMEVNANLTVPKGYK